MEHSIIPFVFPLYLSKLYHKTIKHMSENCIREALANTGTSIFKSNNNLHKAGGGGGG